jgi:hypothetical protein
MMILALMLALHSPGPPSNPVCLLRPDACRPSIEVDWNALIAEQCGPAYTAATRQAANDCRYRVERAAQSRYGEPFWDAGIEIPIDSGLGPGNALYEQCNIHELGRTLSEEQAACVEELVVAAIPDDRAFLEIEAVSPDRIVQPNWPTHCAGIRIEPVWPVDGAGAPLAPGSDVTVLVRYDIDGEGRTTNVRADMIEPGGIGPELQEQFIDASAFAVARWTLCDDMPLARRLGIRTTMVFAVDD